MKIVCAWCSNEIYQESGIEGEGISHGICESCREYFFSDKGPPSFVGFLDMLSVPVIVLDEEVRVVAANDKATKLLGKSYENINGVCYGDAIECSYARLPEGCGRSVHCRSCAVRLTVLDTFMTGRSHYDVPAYHDLSFYKSERNICYLISTEKSGDFVYLRIHEIKLGVCRQGKAA
jgi:hypothetical protein